MVAAPSIVEPPSSDAKLAASLRLKRLFLIGMIASLAVCAAVAVVALLVGQFNERTERILLTVGALAVHCGMALACSASIERQRWTRLSRISLGAFAVNFIVLAVCVWVIADWQSTEKALGTSVTLIFAYVLAIPCANLVERRQWGILPVAGLAAVAVALVMVCICIWAQNADSLLFLKLTVAVAFVALSFAHHCLLLSVPGGLQQTWLHFGTVLVLWALATVSSIMVIDESDSEMGLRIVGALGVLDATGTLSLLILAKLRRVAKVEKLETAAGQIALRCPRCTTPQMVGIGASECSACGLKFKVEIEEPRCPTCDYLLWQLPERRCPECGTTF